MTQKEGGNEVETAMLEPEDFYLMVPCFVVLFVCSRLVLAFSTPPRR